MFGTRRLLFFRLDWRVFIYTLHGLRPRSPRQPSRVEVIFVYIFVIYFLSFETVYFLNFYSIFGFDFRFLGGGESGGGVFGDVGDDGGWGVSEILPA